MTDLASAVTLTVRFFAAARQAAGTDARTLALPVDSTIRDVVRELCGQSDDLALVLQKCSFLLDGVAVRDRETVLAAHQTLDVLPPFAGG